MLCIFANLLAHISLSLFACFVLVLSVP